MFAGKSKIGTMKCLIWTLCVLFFGAVAVWGYVELDSDSDGYIDVGYIDIDTALDVTFESNGILERTGAGAYGIATPGTDYLAPNGSGAALSGIPLDSEFSISGIMKCTGTGTYGIAVEGTDYLGPNTIDDTKGNGDTDYIWSADKIYDQLALKAAVGANDDITSMTALTSITTDTLGIDGDVEITGNLTTSGSFIIGSTTLSEAELGVLDALGDNVATFLGTPSSSNFEDVISDETGTNLLVFNTNPVLVAPALGTIASGVGTALTALNGENIQDDTIDDDSIDFTDVTSTDLTFDADTVPTTSVYSGTTSLEETTAADDSGAYIIGVYDDFTNSTGANVQAVLKDFDTAISAGGSSNVFVNNANYNPNISDTLYDVEAGVTQSTWESIGPTDKGSPDNTWAVLDDVPDDVDWIEIKVVADAEERSGGTTSAESLLVAVREASGEQGAGITNLILREVTYPNTAGYNAIYTISNSVKIPVDSDKAFSIYWSGSYSHSQDVYLVLTGYGYDDGGGGGGGGYTDLTEFVEQTAWRLFYSDGSGDVKELVLPAAGNYFKSNGASTAPGWGVPSGGGDLLAANNLNDVANAATALANLGGVAITTKLDAFGTPDDNTTLNATTSYHGLCPKLGGGTTNYLRADGAWATPAGGSGMVYPGAGIPLSTGAAWTTSITNNSTNWNTAYTDRMKWDGGATGLTAATGRTSLGLGSAALRTAEDTLTDGSNLPDGHAIKTYGDANWGGGLWTGSGNDIYYDSGNVGIGKVPTTDLDVDGTAKAYNIVATGYLYLGPDNYQGFAILNQNLYYRYYASGWHHQVIAGPDY